MPDQVHFMRVFIAGQRRACDYANPASLPSVASVEDIFLSGEVAK